MLANWRVAYLVLNVAFSAFPSVVLSTRKGVDVFRPDTAFPFYASCLCWTGSRRLKARSYGFRSCGHCRMPRALDLICFTWKRLNAAIHLPEE